MSDFIRYVRDYLSSMAPHVRMRKSAHLLEQVTDYAEALQRDLQWERGRYPGKITQHWLRSAFECIAAGEPEAQVMRDYGYVRYTEELDGSVHVPSIASDGTSEAPKVDELLSGMREIYEVWAGSDGFEPQTAPEAYQQRLILQMKDIAARFLTMTKEAGE